MLLAALVGVGAHLGIFIRGEHHMKATFLFWAHIFVFFAIAYEKSANADARASMKASAAVCASYVSSLLASIIFYRQYLHRLRHFPGPRLAATTKLWHAAHSIDSKNHIVLDDLHKKYGDFVRTGNAHIRYKVWPHQLIWFQALRRSQCFTPTLPQPSTDRRTIAPSRLGMTYFFPCMLSIPFETRINTTSVAGLGSRQ